MRSDLQAEQAVIGSAIQSPVAHPALLSLLEVDFVDPKHRLIAAVLRDMIRNQAVIDVVTLATELRARGKLEAAGGSSALHDLVNFAPVPGSAGFYADAVRQATRVRLVASNVATLAAELEQEEAGADLDGLLTRHRAKLDQLPGLFAELEDDRSDTVAALLEETFGPQQWVIPGLLTRAERVVMTGAEGLAKTTLMRQFAICLAGGLNPWNGARVSDGHRVLYVDAENSRAQSHNAYGWISRRVNRPLIANGWADRIIHKTRNDGVDLPGRDAGWFHQMAAQHSPDVIILGPAYKLMRGDPQKDSDVLALLNVIDEVRVKHDAAVFVETHSPHGLDGKRPVRPYGSSVWLRWPEVGFGIRVGENVTVTSDQRPKELEIVGWRGQRESRDWPDLIKHGQGRELPWTYVRPDWKPSVDLNYSVQNEMSAA